MTKYKAQNLVHSPWNTIPLKYQKIPGEGELKKKKRHLKNVTTNIYIRKEKSNRLFRARIRIKAKH